MPKCTWRDRPGDAERCRMVAEAGHSMCPRHEFLDELRRQKADGKEQAKAHTQGKAPRTRKELLQRGYHFVGSSACRDCNLLVEWYKTPTGKNAPYNRMPLDTSPAVIHFATCNHANGLRRSA